jgi:hypothetical protein
MDSTSWSDDGLLPVCPSSIRRLSVKSMTRQATTEAERQGTMTREPDIARRTTRREDGSAGRHRALIVPASLICARGRLSS